MEHPSSENPFHVDTLLKGENIRRVGSLHLEYRTKGHQINVIDYQRFQLYIELEDLDGMHILMQGS